MSNATVKLEDVARLAGVAKSTASMALSGNPSIAEKTRVAVREAAEQLGFEPDPFALRLNGRRSNVVALWTDVLEWSAATRKLNLVQEQLAAAGYIVPLYVRGSGEGARHDDVERLRQIRRQRPRALIYAQGHLGDEARRELEAFQAEGGFLVGYDYPLPLDCDQVVFDRDDNTYQAARYLLEQGHRKIGLYQNGGSINLERLRGFRRALAEFDAPFREEWLFVGEYEDGGARAAETVLAMSDRPTGVALVNDYAGAAFLSTVLRAGWRVPQDISLITHADLPIARHAAVPLTTLAHPFTGIADAVVEMVNSRIKGTYTGSSRRVVLRSHLVIRESVGPPPA
jgi:DNA-binding LacI/PurR family transcriptional regulator